MKKLNKKVREGINYCDLFYVTELVRYKSGPDYKSTSGGICSLAVIIIFIVVFTNVVIGTFDKQTIYTTVSVEENLQPSYFQSDSSSFLFAVGLQGINMNDPDKKWFDVTLSQRRNFASNSSRLREQIQLVQCQRSSWTKINESLGEVYDNLKLDDWLCLPENMTAEFQGKFSSDIFKYLKLSVEPCTNTSNATCATDAQIAAQISSSGSFIFNYYFLNTIINPQNSIYKTFYLEDRNYFQFTTSSATTANIFISTYNVKTDQSLLPIKQWNQELGGYVQEQTQTFTYIPVDSYIELFLRKSSQSYTYTRTFLKYDATLSYIGGLFSSIMTVLMFMNKYNEFAYEIEIGAKTFISKASTKLSNNFNLLFYMVYIVYNICDFVNLGPNWKQIKQYQENREETAMQLDTKLILRKILFLEDCMNYLFEDYELECLHLKNKISLQDAAKKRQKYSYYPKFMKIVQKVLSKEKVSQKQLIQKQGSTKPIPQVLMVKVSQRGQKEIETGKKLPQQKSLQNQNQIELKEIQKEKLSIYEEEDESYQNQFEEPKEKIFQKQEDPQQLEIEAEVQDDSDLQEREKERQFLSQMMNNIKRLTQNSHQNRRAKKIFNNLEKKIKKSYRRLKNMKEKQPKFLKPKKFLNLNDTEYGLKEEQQIQKVQSQLNQNYEDF